jgi:hypothetical protein
MVSRARWPGSVPATAYPCGPGLVARVRGLLVLALAEAFVVVVLVAVRAGRWCRARGLGAGGALRCGGLPVRRGAGLRRPAGCVPAGFGRSP